jgi:hypothetical protein
MECKKNDNVSDCNCTYDPCPRKGRCCDCLSYHLDMQELPACCFPDEVECTYNRSFAKFMDVYREK